MKTRVLLLLCGLLSSVFLFSQSTYSRVRISLSDHSLFELMRIGLDIGHGQYAAGRFFISDFSSEEIARLDALQIPYTIEIEDVQAFYISQNDQELENRNEDACDPFDFVVPTNFSLGSIAGFFTYEEMMENLNAMAAQYPNLISAPTPISTETSVEGRPIYWLQISDNPNQEEQDEPEVLYTALHHSREPNSLSQMIFYMWYLLENYETDAEIKFLVDNTALYFIPCVNPDGYVYNETTNPNGGGLWRKNRKLNDNGSFGVDLNRNYGYEWGIDNQGSSSNPNSLIYRGTGPFSEPETRAVRDFCNAHRFQIALNYHTFGNLLVYPWGFTGEPSPDKETFSEISNLMTAGNRYKAGVGTETVGYTVNGDSDDWMYGDTTSKPAILSFTPEVGLPGNSGGFWPRMNDIERNSRASMPLNLNAARVLHNYGASSDLTPLVIDEPTGNIQFRLKRYGLQPGSLTISLVPVSSNISAVGPSQTYTFGEFESTEDVISFQLNPGIEEGEAVLFDLVVDNGDYITTQRLEKIFWSQELSFADKGDDTSQWSTQGWGTSTQEFVSSNSSITDSPNQNYQPSSFNTLTLNNAVDIPEDYETVTLGFWAKWAIEHVYDYTQVQLSINDGEFEPLCGKYTLPGSDFQGYGEPIYDGVQENWVYEEIDLTDLVTAGDQIKIQFVMAADNFVELDGFYFDDLQVLINNQLSTATINEELGDLIQYTARPNPAGDFVQFDLDFNQIHFQQGQIEVVNMLGQMIYAQELARQNIQQIRLNTTTWSTGLYSYRIRLDDQLLPAKRLVIR